MIKLTSAVVKATKLPVTVKTRLGWDDSSINIMQVAEALQDVGIQALTIHGRTRAQMYKGSANWELISRVKENPRIQIPIFGNGDVDSPEKALEYRNRYGVDGIMIGRGAIGHPWIFKEIKHFFKTGELLPSPGVSERVEVCSMHLNESVRWKGEITGILEMRRHYANYFKGFDHFKDFRIRLLTAGTLSELMMILEEIRYHYQTAAPAA
jgi:nifR3 family TIM-barrel protein